MTIAAEAGFSPASEADGGVVAGYTICVVATALTAVIWTVRAVRLLRR